MSNRTRKSSFHNGPCLNLLCTKQGPHSHRFNAVNDFSSPENNRPMTKKEKLNAFTGINETRSKKQNLRNAINEWKNRNRKSAEKSLRNNARRTHKNNA